MFSSLGIEGNSMDITVTAIHMDIKDSVKEYAEDKLGGIDKFYNGAQSIEVILKNDDKKIHCEAIIHVKKRGTVVVDVAKDELYEAIDVASEKCERQMRRLKEKNEARRHDGSDETVE